MAAHNLPIQRIFWKLFQVLQIKTSLWAIIHPASSVTVVVFRQVVPLSTRAATSRATDFYSISAPAQPRANPEVLSGKV